MSALAGDKLEPIAVIPMLGWCDQRRRMKTEQLIFSLIVSVLGPSVYQAIKPSVEAAVEIEL